MSRIDFAPEITTQSSPNEPGTEANQAMFEEVDNDRKKNSNLSGPGAPTDCESRKPIVEAVHGKIDASRLPTQKAPELLAPELLVSEFKPADAINPDSITPDAIDQAHIADCFFEATLSSLANSEKGREKIKNMIEENADGSFTVRFPGAKDSPINVSKEDIKESGVNNNEKWADVLETAFLEHTHGGKPWSDLFKQSGISPLAGVTTMREAAQLLTGNDVMTDQFALTDLVSGQLTLGHTSKENVRRDLERALENGDTITAGANPSFAKYLGGRDPGPVPDQHVYAVLGFDPETDTVRVRNPWGSMAGSPLSDENSTADGITHLGDGVLSMSMDTFYGRFSDVTISGRNDTIANLEHTLNDLKDSGGHLYSGGKNLLTGDPLAALQDFSRLDGDALNLSHNLAYGGSNYAREVFSELLSSPEQMLNPHSIKSPLNPLYPVHMASVLLPEIELTGYIPTPDPIGLVADRAGPVVSNLVDALDGPASAATSVAGNAAGKIGDGFEGLKGGAKSGLKKLGFG